MSKKATRRSAQDIAASHVRRRLRSYFTRPDLLSPDGTLYVPPQALAIVGGREYRVDTYPILKRIGARPGERFNTWYPPPT